MEGLFATLLTKWHHRLSVHRSWDIHLQRDQNEHVRLVEQVDYLTGKSHYQCIISQDNASTYYTRSCCLSLRALHQAVVYL